MSKKRKYLNISAGSEQHTTSRDPNTDFTWRGDSSVSFSDWELVVTIEGGEAACRDPARSTSRATFHVHRLVLARGKRRCNYFSHLFSTQFREVHERRSNLRVRLLEEAKAVPCLLDFLYSGKLKADQLSALPLLSLGRYLDCPALINKIASYLERQLHGPYGWSNGLTFLRSAYQDYPHEEKLLNNLRSFCARKLYVAAERSMSPFLKDIPHELFMFLVDSPELCQDDDTHLTKEQIWIDFSDVVVSYSSFHPARCDFQFWSRSCRSVKFMSKGAAKTILRKIRELPAFSADSLMDICVRCYDSLGKDWCSLNLNELIQGFDSNNTKQNQLHLAKLISALKSAQKEMNMQNGSENDDDESSSDEDVDDSEEEDDDTDDSDDLELDSDSDDSL